MKLLYAEDEAALAEAVTDILAYHNYLVDRVADGEEALAYARMGDYDGILLDIMLPGLDGLSVLETLRREGDRTPILLLTAKGEVEDRIRGLDLGADDYLVKPFATGELLARIRAMLRRREDYTPTVLSFGDLALDLGTYRLSCGDRSVGLSRMEYRMMEAFLRNQGVYLSTEHLLEKVWGYEYYGDMRAVDVTIRRLREKIEDDPGKPSYILTKRGVGYYFNC